jgi:hypothetical protein
MDRRSVCTAAIAAQSECSALTTTSLSTGRAVVVRFNGGLGVLVEQRMGFSAADAHHAVAADDVVADGWGGSTVAMGSVRGSPIRRARVLDIALNNAAVGTCPAFDLDSNGQLTIKELMADVNRVRDGCAVPAT